MWWFGSIHLISILSPAVNSDRDTSLVLLTLYSLCHKEMVQFQLLVSGQHLRKWLYHLSSVANRETLIFFSFPSASPQALPGSSFRMNNSAFVVVYGRAFCILGTPFPSSPLQFTCKIWNKVQSWLTWSESARRNAFPNKTCPCLGGPRSSQWPAMFLGQLHVPVGQGQVGSPGKVAG